MALPAPVGRQHDVVYMSRRGHHVILGTAGSGKTVMAIHRAFHLAHPDVDNSGPTLLLTFNKSLVTYLRHLASGQAANVTIETYAKFAHHYLSSRGLMGYNAIADPGPRERFVRAAVAVVRATYKAGSTFFDRSIDFFSDELEWIEGNGLETAAQYLATPRVGRQAPLRDPQREAMWKIREEYVNLRTQGGYRYDWASLAGAARNALAADTSPRVYKHIVVDEAQDLSPEAIRSLAAAIPPDGSLTLFADYAQQIYGQRVSWRSCGLSVRQVEEFVDNYRNSPEIAELALAMSEMPHFKDSADLVVPRRAIRAAGAKPTLVHCTTHDDEARIVAEVARGATGVRIGVLTRTRAEARAAVAGLPGVTMLHEDDAIDPWQAPAGVYAGTYHSGKGLEFDVVVLPYCGDADRPDPATVAAFGADEAASRESRLMYVGVTRARDELVITHRGPLTTLLPSESSGLYKVL